jgi:hypothetical protein
MYKIYIHDVCLFLSMKTMYKNDCKQYRKQATIVETKRISERRRHREERRIKYGRKPFFFIPPTLSTSAAEKSCTCVFYAFICFVSFMVAAIIIVVLTQVLFYIEKNNEKRSKPITISVIEYNLFMLMRRMKIDLFLNMTNFEQQEGFCTKMKKVYIVFLIAFNERKKNLVNNESTRTTYTAKFSNTNLSSLCHICIRIK